MCKITKNLSFLVKILYNVTHNKDWKKKTINCITQPLLKAYPVSSVSLSNP